MDETQWLTCNDPQPMLHHLRRRPSVRKLRLFAVAGCRRIWPLLTDARSRRAVEVAEQFADGRLGKRELAAARGDLKAEDRSELRAKVLADAEAGGDPEDVAEARARAWAAAWCAANYVARARARDAAGLVDIAVAVAQSWGRAGRADQASLLRDIFGNPFRRVAVDRSWLAWKGGLIPSLAQAMYDERRFANLPILADALEDAGCHHAGILDHCRRPGEHVRGCWVADLVLGRGPP